jgi:hypothetical protein
MSLLGREPPVSEFLFGMSLMVRFWSETHRSSRDQHQNLALWHTVKFGQLLSFRGLLRNGRGYPVSGHCAAKLLNQRDRTRVDLSFI